MRLLISLLMTACLAGGCDWTPVRDNTVDERSPYYVPGGPPHVEDVRALTDTRAYPFGQILYMFEISCKITDPDYNLVPDSLRAFADTIFVGQVTYNPDADRFYLRCTPESLPGINFLDLFHSVIRVQAVDSAGARDSADTLFNALLSPWPAVRYPLGDTLNTRELRLAWNDWNGLRIHTYSISILKQNVYTIWDTSGLAGTDTVLTVPYDDWDGVNPWVFYAWYLTVVDNSGNRITGEQAVFQFHLAAPLGASEAVEPAAAMIKPE
ncbi:MAG: hypothetical protein NT025_09285 [bacterium]|nr:hypothetical protein [bacterium]